MESRNYTGLSEKQVLIKRKKYGFNEIVDQNKVTPFQILFRQVKNNFVIYLLFGAVLISYFVGKEFTAYTLMGVIVMVVVIGFIQEYKAEEAIQNLKNMIVPKSKVIRDGALKNIESRKIVPEDILILNSGDKIPTDCVILESNSIRANESSLTGESIDVSKTQIIEGKDVQDVNMLFMGTFVVSGKAKVKVIHTGMNTKFGKIAHLISTADKNLVLQDKVNFIAKKMVFIALTISILTGLIIGFRAEELNNEILIEILILVVALAVSAFPEGFPVVLISTLAIGAKKMSKKNALVNRMSIIETLGEVNLICSDKTGTITKGEMAVKRILTYDKVFEVTGSGYNSEGKILIGTNEVSPFQYIDLTNLIKTGVICNDADSQGTPTEMSLKFLGLKAQIIADDFKIERLNEIPFGSEHKFMSVLVSENNQKITYLKGAPEKVLAMCSYYSLNGKPIKLLEKDISHLRKNYSKMEKEAFRVIAFAYKKESPATKKVSSEELVFLGFVGIEDAPREEVFEAIIQTKKSGIKVVMITGDSKDTAVSIASQVGITGKALTGLELDNLTDDEIKANIEDTGIYARVTPEHKIRLVKIFKSLNYIVAMTGDGVNDAPALKEAHVGIAMGKNGTDVSRSASDLILRDDNFATIVTAIGEGRLIFNNIRKFVSLQLSLNIAELLILFVGVLLAPIFGWEVPILASIQILFINLITDNLSALTLGLNPSSPDIYEQKPKPNQKIVNNELIKLIGITSLFMTVLTLSAYNLSINFFNHSPKEAQSVALLTLVLAEISTAFSFRSFRKYIIGRSFLINPYLAITSIFSIFMTLAIIYSPLNKFFETTPLDYDILIIPFVSLIIMIVVNDIIKFFNLKRNIYLAELK
jgi:Ca2+-transporting ATPase